MMARGTTQAIGTSATWIIYISGGEGGIRTREQNGLPSETRG